MDTAPSLTPRVLDIISLLDSRTLMGEIRGHDAWNMMRAELGSFSATDGLILDMSAAAMLDYGFSAFAFGSLFSDSELYSVCRQTIFILAPSSRNAFFEGILKATQRPRKSYSQSQAMFIESGYCCKIAPSRRGPLDFIGRLSSDETTVLNSVNNLGSGVIEQIVGHSGLRFEKVLDDLRTLASKGFVIEHQGPDYLSYVSYCPFLESSEA